MTSKRKQRFVQVIKWYDDDGLTFEQIGQKLKVTRARAHQIYHEARVFLNKPAKKIKPGRRPSKPIVHS